MEANEIQKRLNNVNWNFDFTITYENGVRHPFNCRRYYSYPATFIPEIPYTLIDILSKKGDVVLDPFGGIGTTFMQALTLERTPISCDINPIAISVTKTLFSLFDPSLDLDSIKTKMLNFCKGYDPNVEYYKTFCATRMTLSAWFERETFNEIAYLMSVCDHVDNRILKDSMSLVISSILVTLSSQNKGWAYIADNVRPKKDELKRKHVFDQYCASVKVLFTDVTEHLHTLHESYPEFYSSLTQVPRIFQNSLDAIGMADESVDLIVTSPPYPKMIDYVKSQRLSFSFFNDDFRVYVDNEVGARYRRGRRNTLLEYEHSMTCINQKMYSLLKCDGYLCLVLPDYDQTDNRKEVMDRIVNSYYQLGLTKVYDVSRYIPSHKRTLSIQWASLVNERILVFKKG